MYAVMLAVFPNHQAAEAARVALFTDGFPTDRLGVTSTVDEGPARVEPAANRHDRLVTYYQTLFQRPGDQQLAESIVAQVEEGAATLTVHPRGDRETARANEIVTRARPLIFESRDLDKPPFEFAASPEDQSVVGKVVEAVTG
jgi:hypothetical protein